MYTNLSSESPHLAQEQLVVFTRQQPFEGGSPRRNPNTGSESSGADWTLKIPGGSHRELYWEYLLPVCAKFFPPSLVALLHSWMLEI